MSARIVLLCEDRQTDLFVRRFLGHRNFRGRDITTCKLAAGGGFGEHLVRKQFPGQLKAIRGRQEAFLVVVIDADTGTTAARRCQLSEECTKCGIAGPGAVDRVVVVVPRRNIETWFKYLGGDEVDETIRYPKLQRERDCRPHADKLHEMCHEAQKLVKPAPPSIREACGEYPKLKR
ncbi:hypothetical protein [Candidatus Palauibacter sp.]|uniref:hypothetical protein n=1 Tax=Candidatus Palauibacter sp. TaxID=3101350 RepID=UPI003B02430B